MIYQFGTDISIDGLIKPCAVALTPIPKNLLPATKTIDYPEVDKYENTFTTPKPQFCPYCNQRQESKLAQIRHVKKCHQNIPTHMCRNCQTFFKTKSERDDHFQQVHSATHSCLVCSKTFIGPREKLNRHIIRMHANEVIKCNYDKLCSAYFKTDKERSIHIEAYHESRANSVRCVYCKKKTSKLSYSQHVRLNHDSIAIRCAYTTKCATYFLTQEEREEHISEVHEKHVTKVKCTVCNLFVDRRYVYNHMSRQHGIDIKSNKQAKGAAILNVVCPYCQCKVNWNLADSHIRRNHNARPIKCIYKCGMYFLNDEDHTDHISKIHPNKIIEKPAKPTNCIYCGKLVQCLSSHMKNCHYKIAIRCSYFRCVTYFHSIEEKEKHLMEFHTEMEKLKHHQCSK
jgi:hypothetical protein